MIINGMKTDLWQLIFFLLANTHLLLLELSLFHYRFSIYVSLHSERTEYHLEERSFVVEIVAKAY